MNNSGAWIGIDLGTYNSVAAVSLGGEPVLLRSKEGQTDQGICFPSFVEFDEAGELLRVGEYARKSLDVYPERVVWGVKRMIGKSYEQAKKSGDLERFQYKVVEGRDGSCRIVVGKNKKEYGPTEISSFVLKKIKADAEADFNPLNTIVTEATITVPAFFGPFQRAETEQAAKLAGFEAVHLIPEPTAAALAYKLKIEKQDQFLIVTDIGAGTFDVTIALMFLDKDGVLQTTERSHGGNTALGGLDIDDALFQFAVRTFGLKDVARDPHGKARLRGELERAKIELSEKEETRVTFDVDGRKVDLALTRQNVESAVGEVIDRCVGPIDVALREASLDPNGVSHVLLVGGPTKMPIYRQMLSHKFRGNRQIVADIAAISASGFPVDPMEAVARGAVLGTFGGITPHAYGVVLNESYYELIPRRSRYPCSNSASTMVPGRKRSMALQLIQKELDPSNFQEVYSLLGVFQFDYRPEPDDSHVEISASYSDNGVLDLKIVQPSSMVELPLYGVSKLAGKRITKPSSPLPIGTPKPIGGMPAGVPAGAPPPRQWSQADLEAAVRAATRTKAIAKARLERATPADQQSMQKILASVSEWVGNTWADANTRTPQVRNLNRALINLMFSSRLLSPEELRELEKGGD